MILMNNEPKWLEVSLTVDGEMAEAVADVLARFAPGGVAIESTNIDSDPDSEGKPIGLMRVYAYLPVDNALEENRHHLEEAMWHLGRICPLPTLQFKPIQEVNWTETWKQHYHPVPIGKHLIIIPAWLDSFDKNRIPIRIDPGMAFGTGTHPTTQLCLVLLEEYLISKQQKQVRALIDIGCGSGILSIAAKKMGVDWVLGMDTDAQAVAAARKNAALNGVDKQIEFLVGSVTEIREIHFTKKKVHIVVANILAPILIRLLEEGLGDLVDSEGILILSGILVEHVPKIMAALHARGFQVLDRRQIEDWVALCIRTNVY